MSDVDGLASLLQQNGIILADKNTQNDAESPWFVKLLLAFSGWLASLFMLGFFGALLGNLFSNVAACIVIGMVLVTTAYLVLRLPQSEFLEHMGLAVSLAGQALIAIGVFQVFELNDVAPWMLIALIQIMLAVVMPNFVHGVFSSFLAAIAFSVAFSELGLIYLASNSVMFLTAWLWLNEFKYYDRLQKVQALAYGLTLSLILVKGTTLFNSGSFLGRSTPFFENTWRMSLDELLNCLVLLYVIWQSLKQSRVRITRTVVISVLIAVSLFSLASFQANGLVVGLIVILLGFSASNRILLGLGIAALLFYISAYYYLLDTTLLVKSGTLLAVGLLMLFTRWLLMSKVLVKGGAKGE